MSFAEHGFTITINYWCNDEQIYEVQTFIEKELQENAEDKYIYLVFSVDITKVYANDFDDVEKVLTDFETKYGDRVRYRLSISEGEWSKMKNIIIIVVIVLVLACVGLTIGLGGFGTGDDSGDGNQVLSAFEEEKQDEEPQDKEVIIRVEENKIYVGEEEWDRKSVV